MKDTAVSKDIQTIAASYKKKEKNYWLKKLSGSLERVNFPYDHTHTGVKERPLRTSAFELSGSLSTKLIKLSGDSDPRLFVILVTGLVTVMQKYTNRNDITLGTSILKQEPGLKLINTVLTLRIPIEETISFKELLLQVRQVIKEATENQNYPINTLLYQLNLPFPGAEFPLFDVAILLENIHNKNYLNQINTNITFTFRREGTCINGVGEYNVSLYNQTTIERIIQHLSYLLEMAIGNVETPLYQLDLLNGPEKAQLLFTFNNTEAEYPTERLIHRLFEEQAQRTPGKAALVSKRKNKQLTYHQLNDKVNRLAFRLKDLGVRNPDTIVAVMGEVSTGIVIALLAILKAGGAFLPIDLNQPETRKKYILEDSNTRWLLCQQHFIDKAGDTCRNLAVEHMIAVDHEPRCSGKNTNIESGSQLADLAYVIYTSGTTGAPKGVMLEHRGFLNYITWAARRYVQNEKLDFPLYTSISFDLTITSIFTPLITGNTMVIYSEDVNELSIERIIKENCVGIVKLTPSHLQWIKNIDVNTDHNELSNKELNGGIKRLIVGGEEFPITLARDLHAKFKGNIEMYNEYGPTEATVGCMIYKFNPEQGDGKSMLIGLPIANTRVYILDRRLNPLPFGVPGELCIGGVGLARGYLGKPELTSRQFLPNPFIQGERLYRSGDLARRLPNGDVEFLGRIDNQVKIRGFRIELGEIENQLLAHDNIKDAVVIAREPHPVTAVEKSDHQSKDKSLCAYMVADSEPTVPGLRDYLLKRLPEYMVPSYFVFLPQIPLTANGKIDRNALPAPKMTAEEEYVAPRNEPEKKLAETWSAVLGIEKEKLGIDADFFHLGGHSLKATIMVARIHKELDVDFPLVEIFKNPTIRGMAEIIAALGKKPYAAIAPVEKREYFPLASAQKRLLVLCQGNPASTAYNVPEFFLSENELDPGKLARVFRRLIQRHESLRTSIEIRAGQLVQRIHENPAFALQYEEPVNFLRPFDLTQAPLLRVGVSAAGEGKHLLMVDMHHIISDGVSLTILAGDFIRLYSGEELCRLKLQYKDFTQWQNHRLESGEIKQQEEYWLRQFAGELPRLALPTDHKPPAGQSFAGDKIGFELDPGETNGLKELAHRTGATLFMVLLAIYNVMLSKLTGQDDIVVGTGTAGRRHADLENLIGMFVNTLALRNTPSPRKTFGEFLQEVKERTLQAFTNQDYLFEELVEKLVLTREPNRNPLFDTVLLMQNFTVNPSLNPRLKNSGLQLQSLGDGNKISKFALVLVGAEIPGKIAFTVTYATTLFKQETIERLVTYFTRVVSQVTAAVHLPISAVDILSHREKHQLLNQFNDTASEIPPGQTIVQRFENQVEKTPLHMAVSSPLDLSEIHRQLEADTLTPHTEERMGACCFARNPYLHRSPLSRPGQAENLILLKTHRHHLVIVTPPVVQLLTLFTGEFNLKSLYVRVQGREFLLGVIPRNDLLGISFQFNRKAQRFFIAGFHDFLHLVKVLADSELIRLVGMEAAVSQEEPPMNPQPDAVSQSAGMDELEFQHLLTKEKEVTAAQVLLLGDTPGTPTTGLLYLGSYLRRQGIKTYCQFYDPAPDYTGMKQNLETLLEKIQPRIVAISLKWFLYIARVMEMCEIVKQYAARHSLDLTVVVGGNTASYYWQDLIGCDHIDILVRGDGEEPLRQIARGDDISSIPNCVYKKNGQVFANPVTYIQDKTHSPGIYLSHLEEILLSPHSARWGSFFIYTHKGCTMNCLYCGGSNQAQQKTFHRKNLCKRAASEVRKDIGAALAYTSTFQLELDFPDRDLTAYCRQAWEGLDLSNHFCIFSTLTPPTAALIELVSRTFKYVYWDFDICTLSELHRNRLFSLGLVKPPPSDRDILRFMDRCETYPNIEVRLNLITGLPYFTLEDLEPGERLLAKILDTYPGFGELHWARLHAQPGAPITTGAARHHMHSYATTFADFLKFSRENFNRESGYSTVEEFNYPYIYYEDEQLNSRVTNHYLDINKKIRQHMIDSREKKRYVTAAQNLTYRRLGERARQLAGELRARGAGPGHIVGLLPEHPIDIPVGIFGILYAGCAYMPIDPEFPPARIRYMLEDSGTKLLVTTRNLAEEGEKLIRWESLKNLEILFFNTRPSPFHLTPDLPNFPTSQLPDFPLSPATSLAYLIYTSGTTGQPKGVLLTRQNLVNYVHWFCQTVHLAETDRTALTSSFAFDLGYTSLYPSLLRGGELHLPPRELYLLGEGFLDYLARKGITYLKVTPSMFSVLVGSPNFSPKACAALRLVVLGGEAINAADLEKAHALCPHIAIMNHYGPTEATIGCIATFVDFTRFEEYKRHPVIGKPIHNIQIRILGRDSNLVPPGVPGELTISGLGLASGYLNRPELTSKKFNYNKTLLLGVQGGGFLEKSPPGRRRQKLYLTGDLAQWLADGTIEFLGRVDQQVKVRGYRIELGEIESRLLKHDLVENALVLVKKNETVSEAHPDGKYLCAYIVPAAKESDSSTVRKPIPGNPITSGSNRWETGKIGTVASFTRRFEEIAAKNPEQRAGEYRGRVFTYGQLAGWSRQVAGQLEEEYDDRCMLSGSERTRYKRQMLLHGWGIEAQEKLKGTTVFVAGAGGGGAPTITQLALLGLGTIKICDFDTIELSNLNRQFIHDRERIGMNKALSAQITVQRINPHVQVIPYTQKLTMENVFELVGDSRVIFDMFDGPADKFILSQCAATLEIPHIIIAMTDLNAYAAVLHTPHTPCYHCIFDKNKLETIVSGMRNYRDNYSKNPLAVASPSLFISTGTAVNEALKLLLGLDKPAYNKFFYFNQRGNHPDLKYTPSYQSMTHLFSEHFRRKCREQGFDWEVGWRGNLLEVLDMEPDPDCPLCGPKGKEKRQALQEQRKQAQKLPLIIDSTDGNPGPKKPGQQENMASVLPPGMEMALGLAAVLKAGGTWVPLDPAASRQELAEILEDSASRILLTDDPHLPLAEKLREKVNKNIKIINLDHLENNKKFCGGPEAVTGGFSKEPPGRLHPACLLYTPPPGTGTPGFASKVREFYDALLQGKPLDIPGLAGDGKETPSTGLTGELRRYLREELPAYMIPTYFIPLAAIPLTANGKIDMRALPEPGTGENREPGILLPRDETEDKLAEIWAGVLGIEKESIGIDTNFFQVGGHSLNAAVTLARIHKEMNLQLSLAEMFEMPTIREIAALVTPAAWNTGQKTGFNQDETEITL